MTAVSFAMVTIVVPEMNTAIAHYSGDWGFRPYVDSHHASGHRWVVVDPGSGAKLRLVEATNDTQIAVIGQQAGGRVAFFLNVEDIDVTVANWAANGIHIAEPERCESYGRIVVLQDAYGNLWDVIETQDAARP